MPHQAMKRIRAEYLEMPGLRLTLAQAQRLCGVEASTCRAVLDELVEARFLSLKPDGTYARASEGSLSLAPSVKADLPSVQPLRHAS
jgi:DNA-binding IclR family transcriptional regulator